MNHIHRETETASNNLYIIKFVEGVCLYIDYFFLIMRFLSVYFKTKTIQVVFSFVPVCLFVHYHFKTAGWIFIKLVNRNLRTPE